MVMRCLDFKLNVVESRLAEADASQAWCPEVNNEHVSIQHIYIHYILMDLIIIKKSGICLKLFNDRIIIFLVRLILVLYKNSVNFYNEL